MDEFLLVSPLVTHASETNLNTLLDIYNNSDRIESFGIRKRTSLAVGSLLSLVENRPHTLVDLLVDQLRRCETESCRVIYLEAVRNSKCLRSFEALVAYFEETCSKAKVAANNDLCVHELKILSSYPREFFNSPRLFKRFSTIFYDLKSAYSNDLRTESFNILIEKYEILESQSLLENVLIAMNREMKKPKDVDYEFLLYIQRSILQKAQFDADLKSRLDLALKTSKVTYFKFFILQGLSNVMENSLKSNRNKQTFYILTFYLMVYLN